MIKTAHNYFTVEGDNLDVQKMKDEAHRRVKECGEESTIHFHKHGANCEGRRHVHILSAEGY